MGFLRSLKSTMENANAAVLNANALSQQYAAASQLAPTDLNDPVYAPIAGVSLEMYARLTASMAKLNLSSLEAVQSWVHTQGVVPGTWAEVQTGWTSRMSNSMSVRTRYGVLYSRAA